VVLKYPLSGVARDAIFVCLDTTEGGGSLVVIGNTASFVQLRVGVNEIVNMSGYVT